MKRALLSLLAVFLFTGIAQADCDPSVDLHGYILVPGEGYPGEAVVFNDSLTCSYSIGLANYQLFTPVPDPNLPPLLYSYVEDTIGPEQQKLLKIEHPTCAFELDLFYGPVLLDRSQGQNYGPRLIAGGSYHLDKLCGYSSSSQSSSSSSSLSSSENSSSSESSSSASSTVSSAASSDSSSTTSSSSSAVSSSVSSSGSSISSSSISSSSTSSSGSSSSAGLACNISGSLQQLACAGETASVTINAAGSSAGETVQYAWTTDCPNGSFDNPASLTPVLTFASTTNGASTACNASLTVSDIEIHASANCSAPVSVGPCIRDCTQTINGLARPDRCGVCNGNGQSCAPNCKTIDISDSQAALDGNAAFLRDIAVLSANTYLKAVGTAKRNRDFVTRISRDATALYEAAWHSVYTLNASQLVCDASQFCVTISNAATTAVYTANTKQLMKLIEMISRVAPKSRRAQYRFIQKLLSVAKNTETNSVAALGKVPQFKSECSVAD